MNPFVESAIERRSQLTKDGRPVYNCCQTVVSVFAKDAGYDEQAALRSATYFRGGMQMGSVCGAVTGGLMALGLSGLNDPAIGNAFVRRFRERREGMINCRDLLSAGMKRGIPKMTHCNAVICECVELISEILTEQGVIRRDN